MKKVFVDSNFFLQCLTPDNINWEDLFDKHDQVQVLIPRAVQVEIDRLKQDGNKRRSKRARSANSLIRGIILEDEHKIIIYKKGPFVELTFPPPVGKQIEFPIFLDLTRDDDRIITEILYFKNEHPNDEVYLLTHDTNPLLTAKRCGVDYFVIPDQWLLPPEPDAKDKKIAELEKHIIELRKTIPEIKITAIVEPEKEIKEISQCIALYKSLDDADTENILSEFIAQHPVKRNFSETPKYSNPTEHSINDISLLAMGVYKQYIPPSDEEIEKYQIEDYPNWITSLNEYITSLPAIFETLSRSFPVTFILYNFGNVSAESVLVEFRAYGGILFSRDDEEDKQKEQALVDLFPKPPKPPKGKWETTRSSIASMLGGLDSIYRQKAFPFDNGFLNRNLDFLKNTERDKNRFYYKKDKYGPPTESIVFECEEFRHKIEPKPFNFDVIVPPEINDKCNCAIECIFSSKNLPEPIRHLVKVNIEVVKKDSAKEVYDFLVSSNYLTE